MRWTHPSYALGSNYIADSIKTAKHDLVAMIVTKPPGRKRQEKLISVSLDWSLSTIFG